MITLTGTTADDILFVPTGNINDTLLGLAGDDYLDATAGGGSNILKGGDGNDELYALSNDQLFGEAGDDILNSDGNGSNFLYGGDGNDKIFADRNDTVFGDAGNDSIYGVSFGNKLTGGAGQDSFYLTPGGIQQLPNEILDFTKNEDKIWITAIPEVQTFASIQRVQSGTDTILKASIGGASQDLGILRNVQADTLVASDFGFGGATINHPPDANPDKTITLLEDSAPISLEITVPSDEDGDPLTLKVTAIPDSMKGEVRLSDGTTVTLGQRLTTDQLTGLIFAPVANANGSAGTFSYTVTDGQGGSDSQIVSFEITPDANGGSAGDPHLFTFDGFHYDFQAEGDFILVQARDTDLQVQVRQTPWAQNLGTTVNTGLATTVDGNQVEFYAEDASVWINGLALNLDLGQTQTLGQGSISRSSISGYGILGDLYTVTYGNGDSLSNAVYGGFLMDPTLDLAGSHDVVGLLGNNNGNAQDDLALKDGTVLAEPLAPETLYGVFAQSWQVAQSESLFSTPFSSTPSNPDRASLESSTLKALAERYVFGGNGDDILVGVGASSELSSSAITDIFMGNKGADTFVLGNQTHQYYAGAGQLDYALITDLWAEDSIQLHGSASDYFLGSTPDGLASGTGIFLTGNSNELIGIIQGVIADTLDLLNPSQFHFVQADI